LTLDRARIMFAAHAVIQILLGESSHRFSRLRTK
jgi:hypothetical protein